MYTNRYKETGRVNHTTLVAHFLEAAAGSKALKAQQNLSLLNESMAG